MTDDLQQDWQIEEKKKQGEHDRSMEAIRFIGIWLLLLILIVTSLFRQEGLPVISAALLSSLATGLIRPGKPKD